MAFKDGAGSQTFGGFKWSAAAVAAQFSVVLVAPPTGNHIPSLAVPLQMLVDNNLGGTSDVQIQIATDKLFTNVIWPGSLAGVVNGQVTIQPTGLVLNTLYYWRARCAPAGTTTWGPWSGSILATNFSQVASASDSIDSTPTNQPSNAFDGVDSTYWHSNNSMPHWIQVQIPIGQVSTSVLIKNFSFSAARTPRDFLVQASNDGMTWTTLSTQTGVTWVVDVSQTFTYVNTVAYTYYRISISASNGDNYMTMRTIDFGLTYTPATVQSVIPS